MGYDVMFEEKHCCLYKVRDWQSDIKAMMKDASKLANSDLDKECDDTDSHNDVQRYLGLGDKAKEDPSTLNFEELLEFIERHKAILSETCHVFKKAEEKDLPRNKFSSGWAGWSVDKTLMEKPREVMRLKEARERLICAKACLKMLKLHGAGWYDSLSKVWAQEESEARGERVNSCGIWHGRDIMSPEPTSEFSARFLPRD